MLHYSHGVKKIPLKPLLLPKQLIGNQNAPSLVLKLLTQPRLCMQSMDVPVIELKPFRSVDVLHLLSFLFTLETNNLNRMPMLHHLSFPVADLGRSAVFYDATLSALGYVRVWTHESAAGYKEAAVGYGQPGADDEFAIRHRPQGLNVPDEGFHLAFRAPSREAVTAFYRAALEHGGRDNGGAGVHAEYGQDYFAAFVFDPDGHRIEAVINEKV
jgi:catechol 2,3-dioxygenase-like lactoylglutathione lyase family enzyme